MDHPNHLLCSCQSTASARHSCLQQLLQLSHGQRNLIQFSPIITEEKLNTDPSIFLGSTMHIRDWTNRWGREVALSMDRIMSDYCHQVWLIRNPPPDAATENIEPPT